MDFLKFFNLTEDPFKLLPDPAFFYPSACHQEGLLLMDYAVDQKEGFLLVIGEPGTGKTTLLRVFLEKWKEHAEIAIILTPRLTPEEFLMSVAEDLTISTEHKNKHEIIRALQDFITEKASKGKRVIIIVDEAQNLPAETLEELRLLSNLETDKEKLLQIILLGQPELEKKLMKDALRQLNQRIATRIYLKRLSRNETLNYINHRLLMAGRANLKIGEKAGMRAYRITRGVPRLINMLISRALMASYIEGTNSVSSRHIAYANKSLNHKDLRMRRLPGLVPAAAGFIIFILFGACIYGYAYWGSYITLGSPADTTEALSDSNDNSGTDNFVLVDVATANMRKGPSADAKKEGLTQKGAEYAVLSETRDDKGVLWYKVLFEGNERWISSEVVRVLEAEPYKRAIYHKIYTIQTGSFPEIKRAQNQFDSIVQLLDEREIAYLRIEKVGNYYCVRLGRFEGYTEAKKIIEIIKPQFSQAMIMEAYMRDERIVRLHSHSISADS